MNYELFTCSLFSRPCCRFPLLQVNAINLVITSGAGCVLQPCATAVSILASFPHGPGSSCWRHLPDHPFPSWRHRHHPSSDLCRVHLRPRFSELVLRKLLTPVGLSCCRTSRKSQYFCTVHEWYPGFAYAPSKLCTFLFPSDKKQPENHHVRYFSKLNF